MDCRFRLVVPLPSYIKYRQYSAGAVNSYVATSDRSYRDRYGTVCIYFVTDGKTF